MRNKLVKNYSKILFLTSFLVLSVFLVSKTALGESYAKDVTRISRVINFKRSGIFANPRITPTPTATSTPTTLPTPTDIPTPVSTIGPAGQITKKVMILNFDPLINGITPLHIYQNWSDPTNLQNEYIANIKNISHQYVDYQVVSTQTIRDYPTKKSGFKFTESQYLNCLIDSNQTYCREGINYQKIIDDFNLCTQVNNGIIDEVWIFGGPWFGYEEAAVAGPDISWFSVYTPPITGTSCSKLLTIMGFTYERSLAEMMDNFGHRFETTIRHIYGSWNLNESHEWNRFSLTNNDLANKAGCGNMHFPYNGILEYDFSNLNYVNTRCDDWLSYPSTKGLIVSANCSKWDCNELKYKNYWFLHLPHVSGTANNKLNNWWSYVVDYDNAVVRSSNEKEKWFVIENGVDDSNQTSSTGSEIYFGTNQTAKFNFPNVQISKNTIITDAYLEFVSKGSSTSSISENITISDGTTTTPPVIWPISATWSNQSLIKSINIQSIVQQLVNSSTWSSGKTVSVNIYHLSGTGERSVFAFEGESMAGARLVIKTNGIGNFTPTPSPTPKPDPSPLPNVCFTFKDLLNNDYPVGTPINLRANSTIKLKPTYVNNGSVPTDTVWSIPTESQPYIKMFNNIGSLVFSQTMNPYNLDVTTIGRLKVPTNFYATVDVSAVRNAIPVCTSTLKFVIY